MKKKRLLIPVIVLALAVFIIINNRVLPGQRFPEKSQKILAHRGLAQTFDIEKVKWNTNTAAVIHKPEHEFLENTIPSMRAAFSYGAEIVEFDIRVTRDRELAVFHDYTLNYRTEKEGNISDYTLQELQEMDVGYGYTYDNGKTYPFRSKGIGMMPSFDQVIEEFPQNRFLIHIRDAGTEIGQLLLEKFDAMSREQLELYSIYGNDEAIDMIKSRYPEMKSFTAATIKKALIQYELIGWTGYLPKSIRNMEIHIPLEYAGFLWGWPEKFVSRMEKVNTRVVLVQLKGQWTGGFDTEMDVSEIPDNYYGFIMTDRVDITAPILK